MCDNAYAGLALFDPGLRCVQLNGRLAEIDGLPPEAHLGHTPQAFIPNISDTVERSLRRVLETGEPVLDEEVSGETHAAPGVRRHWLASYQPVRNAAGKVVGVSAAVLEITLRKHAEAALEERKERLRGFIDRAPAAIAMLDTDMRYVAVSRRFLADFRLPAPVPDDLIGHRHDEVFPDAPAQWRDVSRVLAGEMLTAAEDPFPRTDGRIDWVRWEATPWRRDDGKVGGILLFCELITERRAAEEALRKAEARARLALEAANIGNYDWDLRTNELRWEPRVRSMWALAPGTEASIETFFASIHPDDLPGLQAAIGRARDPAGDGVFEAEYRVVSKADQSERWVAAQGKVTFEHGQAVRLIGTAINITERKRTEAELRAMAAELERRVREAVAACEAALARAAHAERIQALGKLAGGIAHDFNNALQAILGGVSLIEARADDPAAVRSLSRVVLDAAERGHAVTRRLLAFGRRDDLSTEALDPAALLAGMPGLLVVDHVGHPADHTEGDAGRRQRRHPLLVGLAGEDRRQRVVQFLRAHLALLAIGEARIGGQFRPADGSTELVPEPVVANHQQLQPAIVLRAVEIGQCVARPVRRLARRKLRADRGARHRRAVGPSSVRIE